MLAEYYCQLSADTSVRSSPCVLSYSVVAQTFCDDLIASWRSEFKGPHGSIRRAGVPVIVTNLPASGAHGGASADHVVV